MARHERQGRLENLASTRVMVALIEAMDTGAMRGEIDLTRLATAACMKRSIESLSRGIASAPAMARKIGGIVAGATVSRCAGKYLGTSESTWAAGCAGRKGDWLRMCSRSRYGWKRTRQRMPWRGLAHEHARQRFSSRVDGNAESTGVGRPLPRHEDEAGSPCRRPTRARLRATSRTDQARTPEEKS